MKIVVICNYSLNKLYTGARIYKDRLTYHLSHIEDTELHILTVGTENRQFKKDNMVIHTIKKGKFLPKKKILYFHPVLLRTLKREIIELDPDVVHAISSDFIYSAIAVFLRDRYPLVLTEYGISTIEHGYYKEDHERTSKKKFFHPLYSLYFRMNEQYTLSKIPNVVVDSLSIKNLVSTWTKSKIYVVPAGIEYEKVKKIQSRTLLNEYPDIFFVNNLQKIKGVDILVKAVSRVITAIPNLSIYIAGAGPQENKLKNLVKRLDLEKHVKFLGFISDDEKYQYYKACKLAVVPSRWDCQPAALFDAAASGKPVIATDMSNPGIVEDGKTGFIFVPEDIEDLANKIILLLKDEKLREEMGRAAEEKVKQYDWSKVAERYVKTYKEAIADFHKQKSNNKQKRAI